jgi:hypothetical protein
VSEDSVVLTHVPDAAPPVVLSVASAPSKKQAQRMFKAISKAVECSALCVDVCKFVAHPTKSLG